MSNNVDTVKLNEVLCEFLEVIIHNILHIRKLYPESIFVPKRKYGIVVYQSVHPQLNAYITDCLKAAVFHLQTQQLKKLILCISAKSSAIEKYVIDVLDVQQKLEDINLYLKLETSLRDFCLRLNAKATSLHELPEDASFNIHLLTTELAKEEFNSNPVFEDFPWVLVNAKEGDIPCANIVPVYFVDTESLKLQLYIEKCCKD